MQKYGMSGLLKQAQKMQKEMQKVQEELAHIRIDGSAGGGMVKAVVNGKQELLELKFDPEVVDPNDVEMLEDLVVAAVNQALKNAQEKSAEEMNKITGGMLPNILPGM